MDGTLALTVTGFLVGVFIILGIWQRRIVRMQDRRIKEQGRGHSGHSTDRPVGQYPQINLYRCLGCTSCVQACPEQGALAIIQGKAQLVEPSRCVGHGNCEQACPVGALTVGLGDTSHRADLPILTPDMETTVPGVFIAGELGGIALIRHAINQGASVVEVITDRLRANHITPGSTDLPDVLIVGCGPAGISAALKAVENGLSHIIIDQNDLGGTVRKYPRHKLTMTQPVDLPLYGRLKQSQYTKEELIDLWEQTFEQSGITLRSGVRFTGITPCDDGILQVETSTGILSCRYLILALGRRGTPRRLGIPGEESERVLYSLIDAASHQDEDILVVGGGDSAIEAAVALAVQPGNRVTLSYRREAFFRLKDRNLQQLTSLQQEGRIEVLLNSQVTMIEERYAVVEVGEVDSARTIPADFVYILAGGEPPYPLLKRLGIHFGGDMETDSEIVRPVEVRI